MFRSISSLGLLIVLVSACSTRPNSSNTETGALGTVSYSTGSTSSSTGGTSSMSGATGLQSSNGSSSFPSPGSSSSSTSGVASSTGGSSSSSTSGVAGNTGGGNTNTGGAVNAGNNGGNTGVAAQWHPAALVPDDNTNGVFVGIGGAPYGTDTFLAVATADGSLYGKNFENGKWMNYYLMQGVNSLRGSGPAITKTSAGFSLFYAGYSDGVVRAFQYSTAANHWAVPFALSGVDNVADVAAAVHSDGSVILLAQRADGSLYVRRQNPMNLGTNNWESYVQVAPAGSSRGNLSLVLWGPQVVAFYTDAATGELRAFNLLLNGGSMQASGVYAPGRTGGDPLSGSSAAVVGNALVVYVTTTDGSIYGKNYQNDGNGNYLWSDYYRLAPVGTAKGRLQAVVLSNRLSLYFAGFAKPVLTALEYY